MRGHMEDDRLEALADAIDRLTLRVEALDTRGHDDAYELATNVRIAKEVQDAINEKLLHFAFGNAKTGAQNDIAVMKSRVETLLWLVGVSAGGIVALIVLVIARG